MSLKILSCNILKKEIEFLAKKNNWNLDSHFLESSLHNSFQNLNLALHKEGSADVMIYGDACLPNMADLAQQKKALLPNCHNCLEMLMPPEIIMHELTQGAYILLEGAINNWTLNMQKSFGSHRDIRREIFKADRKYILAIKTPCSTDYKMEAEKIAKDLDVELRWKEITLDHFEALLTSIIPSQIKKQTRKES